MVSLFNYLKHLYRYITATTYKNPSNTLAGGPQPPLYNFIDTPDKQQMVLDEIVLEIEAEQHAEHKNNDTRGESYAGA